MKNQSNRLIKPLLLMAFSFILMAACYPSSIQKSHLTLQPSPQCQINQREFDEICVPLKPQRIIALNHETTLDPLIALGVKPIGFASINYREKELLFGVSSDEVAGIQSVGDASQPSLEKILMLKPDLILATDYDGSRQRYKLLSAIAPTVLIPPPENMTAIDLQSQAYFEYNLRYVAKLIGEETKAEEVLSQYYRRIEELRKRLGNQLQQIEISVLFCGEGYIWTAVKGIYPIYDILDDIGLHYKSSYLGGEYLSIETINRYDADILFIVDVDERTSSYYFQNPMFSNLKAVKNNQAYVVSQEKWRTHGISGANKILDDLFKYLPENITSSST